MRHLLLTSTATLALLAGGASPAEAKTAIAVHAPSQATHSKTFAVTARGGTDTAGMRVRVCVAKVTPDRRLAIQACATRPGATTVTAHPTERSAGKVVFVGAVYSSKGNRLLATSTPVTVNVR